MTKTKNPHLRHQEIATTLKKYVENPDNFPEGSKSMREIAVATGIEPTVAGRALKLMFYKGEFAPTVKMRERPGRLNLFYCEKLA